VSNETTYEPTRAYENMTIKDKMKISFFENIIYWFWFYSLKVRAMYPWSFARAIASMLKFSNAAFIAFIILKTATIENNKDVVWFVISPLFIIIIIADMVLYDSRRYCILKNEYGIVWDEKYCILEERYGILPESKKKKYKRVFYLYLIITAATNTLFGLYLYNN
jgi:hypothetical protein